MSKNIYDIVLQDFLFRHFNKTNDVITKDGKVEVPGYELVSTATTTDIISFEYQSYIIENDIDDPDDIDHREAMALYNAPANFLTYEISAESFEDGFEFTDKEGNPWGTVEYEDDATNAISNDIVQLKTDLDKLLVDGNTNIMVEATTQKRINGVAAILVHVGTKTNDDVKQVEEKYTDALKEPWEPKPGKIPIMLEVFGPLGKTVKKDGFEIKTYNDRTGKPEIITVTIPNVKSKDVPEGTTATFDIHTSRVIFLQGPKKDRTIYGQNVLAPIWQHLMYYEWNHFSFADFANKRGGFLELHTDQPLQDDKLDSALAYLQRVQPRGSIVTRQGYNLNDHPSRSAAVDIKGAIDAELEGIAAGSKVPKDQFTGSPQGQLSSARANQMKYYPTLRKNQLDVERQVLQKLIHIMRPDLEQYIKIQFNMQYNLSDLEKADLENKEENNLRMKVERLISLGKSIGEICDELGIDPPEGELDDGTKMVDIIILEYEKHMEELRSRMNIELPPTPPKGVATSTNPLVNKIPETSGALDNVTKILDNIAPEYLLDSLIGKAESMSNNSRKELMKDLGMSQRSFYEMLNNLSIKIKSNKYKLEVETKNGNI